MVTLKCVVSFENAPVRLEIFHEDVTMFTKKTKPTHITYTSLKNSHL